MRSGVDKVWVLVLLVAYARALGDTRDQFLESIERTKIVASPGRHVCTTESVISRPVPVVQTYKKPVYTSRPRDCPNLATCPQYDVQYIPANRTVYQLQKYSKLQHSCCPGWTKSQKRQKGCMGPICRNGCGEFGLCVKPEMCQCRTGFAGDMCDTDIDECKGRDHGCTQMCKNTAGSYMCACQQGFVLASDGKTCNFCFECQKEYVSMMGMMKELQQEINLKTEKENIQRNMTKEIKKLQKEVVYLQNKNKEVEEMHNNATTVFLELKAEVHNLTRENLVLKSEVASLEHNQTMLVEEMEILKIAPSPPKTTPTLTTTQTTTPLTTKTTTTTTTTSKSTTTPSAIPTSSENPFEIQFDPVDMIMSLSNQIGLMEEKLDLCACFDSGSHRRRP